MQEIDNIYSNILKGNKHIKNLEIEKNVKGNKTNLNFLDTSVYFPIQIKNYIISNIKSKIIY